MGLFFFDEADRQPSSLVATGPRLENRLDPRVEANASAGFGQATVAVSPRVSVTAGLRYTHERKTIDNRIELYTIDAPITLLSSSSVAYADAISHDAWSPKFGVEFHARQNLLTYASATRGFKTGGFNLTSPEAGRGFAPEWAWSYEAGMKTDFGSGRGRLNVAAFHTDYTDLQVQTPIRPNVFDVSNAAAATIDGVEVETVVMLGGGVQVGGHLAWLDATYDQYLALGAGGVLVDVAGHRLNNTPAWSGRIWIDWTRVIGGTSSLSLRADATGKSTVFFTPFNDGIQRQRPFGLLDISAEFGAKDRRWFVAAFARNLTDEDYITGAVGTPPPAIGGRPGDRRQFGVQLGIGR
jgi:iron complex outermembrane receptor protein